MIKSLIYVFICLAFIGYGQSPITLHEFKSSDVVPLYSKESKSSFAYLFSVGGDQLQPIGFQGRSLEPYLQHHAGAYDVFLEYRTTVKNARITNAISNISTAGLATFLLLQTRNEDFGAAKGISLGVFFGGVVLGRFSARSYKKARNKFVQSVDIYNSSLPR